MLRNRVSSPKLTLITLVYNQAPFLKERIHSILSQTIKDFEWVVLDDCSTDNSAEILKEQLKNVPQIKCLILHNENAGVYKSYEEALSYCEGRYVSRAEGDDTCYPDFLEKSLTLLENNPKIGFVHTAYHIIDAQDRILRTVHPVATTCLQSGTEVFSRLALQGNFICSPSVTFSRHAYESVGAISNQWTYAGDYELLMKLSSKYDVGYINEPILNWRRLPQAISKRGTISLKGATEGYRVLNKVFSSLPPDRKDWARLHRSAIRGMSTSGMAAKAFWWLFYRRNPHMAFAMLKEANHYDPGVWRDLSSYVSVFRHLAPAAFRRLVKGRGGAMDFLPRKA